MQQHARCLRRLPRLRDEGCTQLAADVCVFSCVFYWYMWQRKRYIWYIFLVHSLRALAPVRFVSERKIRKRNPASNYFGSVEDFRWLKIQNPESKSHFFF